LEAGGYRGPDESADVSRAAPVYAVLGMHRSGTSWLAGSLETRGLALGDVNESATYNAKGTRENDELQAIHVAVLRESGGSWRDIPRRIVWSDARRDQLRAFIDTMNTKFDQWGFKDPRTLLLLDEWERQQPDLEFVGIYRHPEAVARSLAKREFSPVPHKLGIKLWNAYNERLVAIHQRKPFPIMRFDQPAATLDPNVDAIAKRWQLPNAGSAPSFFATDLVHETPADEAVPRSSRRIWSYLVEHTQRVQ
jgi:hypothetical protein